MLLSDDLARMIWNHYPVAVVTFTELPAALWPLTIGGLLAWLVDKSESSTPPLPGYMQWVLRMYTGTERNRLSTAVA